jgi:hypothetical protein
MRIKHNNISFMPINLDDAYRQVAGILNRHYDSNIDARVIAEYIDKAARALWQDLSGRNYRSWDEVYGDFYSGNWGTGSSGRTMSNAPGGATPFAEFVAKLNMGVTREQAMQTPRAAFRQMALKLHPDSTEMPDKAEASRLFSQLADLYGHIPNEMKNAEGHANWFKKAQTSIHSGMKGTYSMGTFKFPVVVTQKVMQNIRGKNVELWEMIDLSSGRKMYMYTPGAFIPDTGANAV